VRFCNLLQFGFGNLRDIGRYKLLLASNLIGLSANDVNISNTTLVDTEFSSSYCLSHLSASHLKTTLRACFVEEGFEAIWHHIAPHDLHETAIQHANGGDCSPEHSVFQCGEQMTNQPGITEPAHQS
jgi:hypothetical protein